MKYFIYLLLITIPAYSIADDVNVDHGINTYYLYVFLHDDNTNGERFRTKTNSKIECLELLNSTMVKLSGVKTSESPIMAVVWCGSEHFQRNYNSTWYEDDIKF